MNKVTVKKAIEIKAPSQVVWDYTQNWRIRHKWDRTVVGAEYLSEVPQISVKVKGAGGLNFNVQYNVSQRPHLTTLIMSDLNSFWLKGGGGSWKYEEKDSATVWTQTNTLIIREGILGRTLLPVFRFFLSLTTAQMMKRAKSFIESGL